VKSPPSTPFNSASDAFQLHPDVRSYGTATLSGRLLVGLRYWNEIDESGVSRWRFESRDAEGMKAVRASEKTLFWYSLYAVPAAWLALAIVALARLHLGYLLVCAVALALGGANLVGYTKCDKDAQANVSNFARTAVWNSVMPSFMQKT